MKIPGEITRAKPPFDFYPLIVAEMGANHMGDLMRARSIVEAAAGAGADALKLQTFTADSMVARRGPPHRIEGSIWNGRDLWDLYEECSLPWSWHEQLFELGRSLGLLVFSTPFDAEAIDFLERLACPMYKIASFEILDLELIAKAATTGKPLVISTGMATLEEISTAVEVARLNGCVAEQLTLLKCTSAYPAAAADTNLATMNELSRFGCKIGLSDHTRGFGAAVAAALEGADMIEKHMGGFRQLGPDEHFSLDPIGMEEFVRAVHDAMDSIGIARYGPLEAELPMLALRRTLRASRDIAQGDPITRDNVKPLRPGGGLEPVHFHKIVGMRATRAVSAGEPITWAIVRVS